MPFSQVAFAQTGKINILVFSKTAAFRHESIGAGKTALAQMARDKGFTASFTEDAEPFKTTTFMEAEKTLIIYGSLAPNAPNHSVVAHIKGDWQQGIVRGKLLKEGWGADIGYLGFQPCSIEEQEEIPVLFFFLKNYPQIGHI